MATDIAIFNNPELATVRTIEKDGRVLFCGGDVATALGYAHTKDALARHCSGVVKRYPIVDGLGRTQVEVMDPLAAGDPPIVTSAADHVSVAVEVDGSFNSHPLSIGEPSDIFRMLGPFFVDQLEDDYE